MTDTQTNSFVAQLRADSEKYQDSTSREEYCDRVREQAAEHFLDKYLASKEATDAFRELSSHRSKLGLWTVRLVQWQNRGPTYLDQSLSDLLDLGDLLQRMQDHLDVNYGVGEFRVFNHRVHGDNNRMVSLTVSWDKAGFENIDTIIEKNRQRAHEWRERRQQRLNEPRSSGDGSDGERLPRRRDAGRQNGDRHPPRRREYDTRREGFRYDDREHDNRRESFRHEGREYDNRREPSRYDDRPRRAADRGSDRDGGRRSRRTAVSAVGEGADC